MRSPHCGVLDGVLGWGCFYRADTVILLGAFGVGTGVAELVLGVAALLVLCWCARGLVSTGQESGR